jgi:hypothetical protein
MMKFRLHWPQNNTLTKGHIAMNKAELKKSHDAMAVLLRGLCQYSDDYYNGRREMETERRYQKAKRLLRRAGFPYKRALASAERTK